MKCHKSKYNEGMRTIVSECYRTLTNVYRKNALIICHKGILVMIICYIQRTYCKCYVVILLTKNIRPRNVIKCLCLFKPVFMCIYCSDKGKC